MIILVSTLDLTAIGLQDMMTSNVVDELTIKRYTSFLESINTEQSQLILAPWLHLVWQFF